MLPFIAAGIAVCSFFGFLFRGPSTDNDTVAEVEARLQHEEEIAAQRLANTARAETLNADRERTMEAARLLEERDQIRAERRADAELRLADEEERNQLAGEIQELQRRERQLQHDVCAVNRRLEQERIARVAAEQHGHGPLRTPTRAEHDHARQITQYSTANFHFAVVGRAGSGKPSLINAFRNLKNRDPGAAPTGTRETTLEIGRYPDPGAEPPRKSMVWFDVPGAGTLRVSHHDYFIKQGLYVFDVIILAMGDRFEEIDARILENCARFKIPVFIVRSKADMHIRNSMQEYDDREADDDRGCYDRCCEQFIVDTQNTVDEELTRQGLPTQHVYIVSRDVLRRTYHASVETSRLQMAVTSFARPEKNLIHESHLVSALLTAAVKRRCVPNTEQTPLNWMRAQFESVLNRFSSGNNEGPTHTQNRVLSRITEPELQVSQHAVSGQLPMPRAAANIRKVIYLRSDTSAAELYVEIVEHNPGLENMLVGLPTMFTPAVAVLTFRPVALVPFDVHVFGGRHWLAEYYDNGNRRGRDGERVGLGFAQEREVERIFGSGWLESD